jgi:flagellar biosynthesis/type III secretory pathway protein FliH
MIRAVIDNAEEHSGHLAEGEVARLISVLQKAEFKRSEARNFKKDQTFKPRSLMEIAVESQRRDAEIEAAKQAEEAVAEAKRREAAKAQSDPVIDRTITDAGQIDDGQIDGTQIENSQIDKDADAPTTPGDDTGSIADDDQLAAAAAVIEPAMADATAVTGKASGEDIPAKELEGQPAANTGDTADNADTGNVDTGNTNDTLDTGEAQVASNFETVTAAFERGKAEGIAEGRAAAVAETKAAAEAAAQDKLAAAVKLFEDGLAALAKPQALQAEALSRSIQTAILKLANQRAGQQIDEMPDAFLTRIEKLVTSIGQKMAAGKVRINAEDYAAMKPHLQNAAFDFIADPIIARGDIILKFDGVELHDIAAQRISSSYSDPVTDSKQNSETVSETGVKTEVAAIEPPLAETVETAETAETDSAQNEQVSKPDDKASS